MSGMFVISPHLDDAVLSAGQALAGCPGSTVLTVFAGTPPPGTNGQYDLSCGFTSSRQAMSRRHREDLRAMEVLEAKAVHLDLLDSQYGQGVDDEQVALRLSEVLLSSRPSIVMGPVGLSHPDHKQLARVWPTVARAAGASCLAAYEDLPYSFRARSQSKLDIATFAERHQATPSASAFGDLGKKSRALLAYSSQLRWIFPLDCVDAEQLWLMGGSEGA